METELNIDIAGKVSELETLLKKVLPRNILWKMVLSRGLEFDGYRIFTPDDDANDIDWKATVRAGNKPLLKKYIEEKDRKFMFLIDVSENMVFGSTEKLKCEYTAELAASIMHLILMEGDRAGFVLYNDDIVRIKQPALGKKQFDLFAYEISKGSTYGGNSNLNIVLDNLIKTLDRSLSLIFIVSDFVRVDASYRKNLEIISNLFETVAIIVRDPLDKAFPSVNKEIVIEDPESHERLLINPRIGRQLYEQNSMQQLNYVKKMFRDFNIDFLELSTEEDCCIGIAEFLRERLRGGRITKR